MIYCQLLTRAELPAGQPLSLSCIAQTLGLENPQAILLPCPDETGVWRIDAISAAAAIRSAVPDAEVTLLGADACLVRRLGVRKPDRTRLLRATLAFIVLFMGSLLGMSWFHSDVGMPGAMLSVYGLLTGHAPSHRLLITIPYAIGVALGTGFFYALGSRRAVTPMDVKFSDYRDDMERAEAQHVE